MDNQIQRWQPRPLPKLSDLHFDVEQAFAEDELNRLLYQPIPKQWLKKRDGREYLPIDKVEYLLTKIFGTWKREIIEVKQLANSVHAIVRVHVRHPFTGEWLFHDGSGAVPIQQDSGTKPIDMMTAIKTTAIQQGAPAAVSFATKDAAENFGTIFGKDLNKKDSIQFTGEYQNLDLNQNKEANIGKENIKLSPSILPEIKTPF